MQSASSPRLFRILLLLTLGCISCSGAGERFHPVLGKVLYKDQPAPGVVVTFHPKTGDLIKDVRPVAMTKEDGSFLLMTGQHEGAKAGEYTITFIWPQDVKPKGKTMSMGESSESVDRLKGAYVNAASSPFKAQIKDGPNQLEPFVLK